MKQQVKYITNFEQIGCSTVDVNLICKDWNKNFSISTWINEDVVKYTLIIKKSKNIITCKTTISKEQADEIIYRLGLAHVKSSTFKSGGTYLSRDHIQEEIKRISKTIEEK